MTADLVTLVDPVGEEISIPRKVASDLGISPGTRLTEGQVARVEAICELFEQAVSDLLAGAPTRH